jgi:octaprenyl-diphosphate synthase
MTLPLIYTLNQVSKKDKDWIINSVKNHNKDKQRVNQIIDFVKSSGGLEYAQTKMKAFQKEASEILQQYPESKYKASLQLMIDYVIDREK